MSEVLVYFASIATLSARPNHGKNQSPVLGLRSFRLATASAALYGGSEPHPCLEYGSDLNLL